MGVMFAIYDRFRLLGSRGHYWILVTESALKDPHSRASGCERLVKSKSRTSGE